MPLAQSYEQARIQVEPLVDRFHRNLTAHKRTEYREEEVRVEFINPFFEALGCDVRNTTGYADRGHSACPGTGPAQTRPGVSA